MLALVDLLLLLLPVGLFLLWRLRPAAAPSIGQVLALVAILALGLGVALWIEASPGMPPGSVYRPATLGADGQVEPGRAAPR
jgi:hypothetical protein